MPIIGDDERRRILKFDDNEEVETKPLPSIIAIDSTLDGRSGFGTGVVISPNFVLTAAHVLLNKSFDPARFPDELRVSSSNNQKVLNNRKIGADPEDPGGNVNVPTDLFLPFDREFRNTQENTQEENRFDIGLIELNPNNTDLILDAPPVGLTAFVAPRTVTVRERQREILIQTAGYPVDNVPNTYPPKIEPDDPLPNNDGIPDRQGFIRPARNPTAPDDFSVQTRDLVLAPGILDNEGEEVTGTVFNAEGRRIQYSENIDTIPGQSGSPVWHTFEEDDPRVLAVHSRGGGFRNAGTLIDTEAYNLIMAEIEGDEDPDELPENLIIGSDPISRPIPLPDLPGNDLIKGTYRKERILGGGDDDTISGAGADDRLEGEEGNDILDGGSGNDILDGGSGDDRLQGGDGDDLIDGGTNPLLSLNPFNLSGSDVAVYRANRSEYDIDTQTSGGILGSPIGEETVTVITHLNNGIDGQDTLSNVEFLKFADGTVPLSSNDDDDDPDGQLSFDGTSRNDRLFGNTLGNLLRGEAGNDRLEGREGNDTLEGGNGFDILKGEDDNDSLVGGGFGDTLLGGFGNDTIEGDEGNDRILGSDGFDTMYGGSGNDLLNGGNQRDLLIGDGGDDEINGGNDSDSIFGRMDNDLLRGQNGNDTLFGGDGEDSLEGGNNRDRLAGGEDDDILIGGADIDRLDGGSGSDTLTGGSGRDNFVFNELEEAEEAADTITDFSPQDDTMWFVTTGFAGISTRGMISSQMLRIGSDATTTSHRFIYSSGSGDLFYDRDGSGSAAKVLLAELDSGLALTNADFRML